MKISTFAPKIVKASFMETKNLLLALIEDFSTENLIQLFRQKTRTFRQIDEEARPL